MSTDLKTVRVGLIQTHADPDPASNLERTLALIAKAAQDGADLVVTQELFRTPYFCQTEDPEHFALAEEIPGPTTALLGEVAKQHQITLLASLFERRAPGIFHNTSVVIGPDGSLATRYRKMHIPDDPRFYEKFYFAPGDLGFLAVETPKVWLGPLICWDQWFPEAARATALLGAELLAYPTAIGTWSGELHLREKQHDMWRTVQRAHAIANGVYVLAVNRIGVEGELHFWGHSFVAAPDGRILAEAGDEEAVLVVDLDLGAIGRTREGWPFFRDRRVDHYEGLLDLWGDDED